MKAGFDQVRVDLGQNAADDNVGSAAKTIIAARHTLQVASAVGAGGSECNTIVAQYGECLKGALLSIIRESIMFDADVLPFDKDTIKSALVDCARQEFWSESECILLGDLHFYLSYFRVGLSERGDELASVLLSEQRAEGIELRSEWLSVTAGRRWSWLPQFLTSWLKH